MNSRRRLVHVSLMSILAYSSLSFNYINGTENINITDKNFISNKRVDTDLQECRISIKEVFHMGYKRGMGYKLADGLSNFEALDGQILIKFLSIISNQINNNTANYVYVRRFNSILKNKNSSLVTKAKAEKLRSALSDFFKSINNQLCLDVFGTMAFVGRPAL